MHVGEPAHEIHDLRPLHGLGLDALNRCDVDLFLCREAGGKGPHGQRGGSGGAPQGARGAEGIGLRVGDDVSHEKFGEGVILEIVRPGTGDPVPEGDVGEVVVTTFNKAYPLIRFGTGDMSAVLPGTSPCGRTNMRIKGWMGRADQRTKVRGMFVDPEQIENLNNLQKQVEELGRKRD